MKAMSLSEIVTLPEFAAMSAGQQMWIRAYFTSLETTGRADTAAAIRIAYPATAPQNIASRACHVLSHKKIKAVLAIAFNKPVLASILPGLDEALKKSIAADLKAGGLTIATQRAIQFYEHQVRLSRAKEAEDATPRYAIGSVLEQDGKRYRVVVEEIPHE